MRNVVLGIVPLILLGGCGLLGYEVREEVDGMRDVVPRVEVESGQNQEVVEKGGVSESASVNAGNYQKNIQLLTSSDYLGDYAIEDDVTGTEVRVTISGGERVITSNALPNHETGAFPNPGNPNEITAQEKTWTLPLDPTYTGAANWVRELGVAINGVKLEPETAERVRCASGEEYKVEAIQNFVDLGLDQNNAHVQPTGEYHYHGVSDNVIAFADKGQDLVHVGFAQDGFAIAYSQSGAYSTSYQLVEESRSGTDCVYENPQETRDVEIAGTLPDGTYVTDHVYVEGSGALDACNGVMIDGVYVYIISEEYPFIGRCLNGEYEGSGGGAAGTPRGARPEGPPPRGTR